MSVSEPGKIITPWAESGLKNTIPAAVNPATGRASFEQGFSAINMTAKEAGGIPPLGQDFNGIFYEITNILRYMQAGGQPTFSSALATAIGGYPKGAMVLGSDGVTLWQSKIESNSTDPNIDPSGWGTFDIGLKADLAAPSGAGLIGGLPVFVTATKYAGGASTSSTNNDAAITAAINDAIATGSYVYWPAVYEVQGNIPNFHSVRHDGPGGIKRGPDTFMANPLEWTTQNLYTSPSATANGDGISPSNPIPIDKIRSALSVKSPLIGSWVVNFSAGTYPVMNTLNLSGIQTVSNFLLLKGPSVSYGVPTAVLSGVGSSAVFGVLLGGRQQVRLLDIKVSDFTATDASGVSGLDFCEVWADNLHVSNCSFLGLGVSHGRMRVTGGIYEGCRYNLRPYNLTEFTIGYNGVGTIARNPAQFGANLLVRDGSMGVSLAGSEYTGASDGEGIYLVNFSRIRLTGTTSTGNKSGVRAILSTYFDDGSNTITGNTENFTLEASFDEGGTPEYRYDPVTKRHAWGVASPVGFKYQFRNTTTNSGMTSAAQFVFEDASPNIGLKGDGLGTYGIICGKPGVSSYASFVYNSPDNTWRWRINNADAYRMGNATFNPTTDNLSSLGLSASRWSVVYAGTGTINTSDEREKTSPEQITDAMLDAADDISISVWKWLSAIALKGEESARWHFGPIAQQVRDAFAKHGLNGCDYGLLCYDEWEDQYEDVTEEVTQEDGTVISVATGKKNLVIAAGNRWGIRPDQCLWLKMAATERRCERIESRLEKAGL